MRPDRPCLNLATDCYRRSQPDASIPNHTVPETAISYYKRMLHHYNCNPVQVLR
jgi:hypothetical protein